MAAIDKIERDLELLQDANSAYSTFKELIFSEIDSKLPKRKVNNCENKTAKSLYKRISLEMGSRLHTRTELVTL